MLKITKLGQNLGGKLLTASLFPHNTTMHSALWIHDILDAIFAFTDPGADASAALVCKTWFVHHSFSLPSNHNSAGVDMAYFGYDRQEIALDVLWYHVDRLDRLFNILAPMTYSTPTTLVSSPLRTDTVTLMLTKHRHSHNTQSHQITGPVFFIAQIEFITSR